MSRSLSSAPACRSRSPSATASPRPTGRGLREDVLKVQRNPRTGVYQWPPQWIAHDDQTFELDWVEVAPRGVIYSWTRVWHPVHPALQGHGPYIVVWSNCRTPATCACWATCWATPARRSRSARRSRRCSNTTRTPSPPYTLVQWRLV